MSAAVADAGAGAGRAELALSRPLDCTLSLASGEAGPSMQRFIQEHLTSFLQPIAEHVRELQEQMQTVARDLERTDARVYGYLGRVDLHERHLSDLQRAHADTGTAVRELHASVSSAGERHEALEQRHGETRDDIRRMHRDLDLSHSSLEELRDAVRRAGEEAAVATAQLREEQARAVEVAAGLGARLDGLEVAHRDLSEEVQGSMSSGLQEVMDLSGLADQRLDELEAAAAGQRKGHDRLLQDVRALDLRLSEELRVACEASDRALQDLSATLRADLCSAARAEELQRGLAALKEQVRAQSGLFEKRASKLNEMFGQVSKGLSDVQEAQAQAQAEKAESEGDQDDVDAIAELGRTMAQNAAEIKQQAACMRHLREADERRSRQLQGLEERVVGIDDRARELAQQGEAADSRLRACEASQREQAAAIAAHRLELDRAHRGHQQLITGLGGATANLRLVGDQVRLLGQDSAKQAAKLEAAHECLDGLGRGLQDTHRSVLAGHDGLLPPRSGGGLTARCLPKLAGSGGLPGGAGRD